MVVEFYILTQHNKKTVKEVKEMEVIYFGYQIDTFAILDSDSEFHSAFKKSEICHDFDNRLLT